MTKDKRKAAAERKRLERKRKRDSGLVPKELWVKPENWEKVKKYNDKLNK